MDTIQESCYKICRWIRPVRQASIQAMDSYGLSQYSVKTGSFVEDARVRWYVCLVVDSPKQASQPQAKP